MCIAVKRGEGGGGREKGSSPRALSLLTTQAVWKLLSGVRVVYVLGWEYPVPDCRAVWEQRLNMKQDYTITSSLFGEREREISFPAKSSEKPTLYTLSLTVQSRLNLKR